MKPSEMLDSLGSDATYIAELLINDFLPREDWDFDRADVDFEGEVVELIFDHTSWDEEQSVNVPFAVFDFTPEFMGVWVSELVEARHRRQHELFMKQLEQKEKKKLQHNADRYAHYLRLKKEFG